MKFLLFALRQSPWVTSSAIVVGALGGLSGAAAIAIVKVHLEPGETPAWASPMSFAGIVAFVFLTGILSRILMIRLVFGTAFKLRMRICRQVMATPLRQVEEYDSKIFAALTEDITVLTNAMTVFPRQCINVAVVLGCLGYLFWFSPRIMGVVLFLMVIAVLSVKLPERPALRMMSRSRKEWDALVENFQALVGGIKELQLNRARRWQFYTHSLEASADAFRRHLARSLRIYAVTNSWTQVLFFIGIGLLIFDSLSWMAVEPANLVGFTLVALYMQGPLVSLVQAMPMYARARVALKKLQELGLSLFAESPLDAGTSAETPAFHRIELDGVVHSYYREREEDHFVLGPIDLTLEAGEVVFLVGGNGSGKTTLAKLVTGLYMPESGEIRLNGQVVDEANREDYRQCFSGVFAEFHLFQELLGLGAAGADLDEEARAYLAKLHLDHKVEIDDGVLSTTALSTGQRKRLALLTAYLEDRPVYIFDEWAADQDPEFKEIFYRMLVPELKARGKLVIVISHDDRYFDGGDRIVKLEYGRMVEAAASLSPQSLTELQLAPSADLVSEAEPRPGRA